MDDKQHTSFPMMNALKLQQAIKTKKLIHRNAFNLKRWHFISIHNWYNPNNSCHHSCCIYFINQKISGLNKTDQAKPK